MLLRKPIVVVSNSLRSNGFSANVDDNAYQEIFNLYRTAEYDVLVSKINGANLSTLAERLADENDSTIPENLKAAPLQATNNGVGVLLSDLCKIDFTGTIVSPKAKIADDGTYRKEWKSKDGWEKDAVAYLVGKPLFVSEMTKNGNDDLTPIAPGGNSGRKYNNISESGYSSFKRDFEDSMRTRSLDGSEHMHPDKNGYMFKWNLGWSYIVFVRNGYFEQNGVQGALQKRANELTDSAYTLIKKQQLNSVGVDELNLGIQRILKERDDYLTKNIPQLY